MADLIGVLKSPAAKLAVGPVYTAAMAALGNGCGSLIGPLIGADPVVTAHAMATACGALAGISVVYMAFKKP